MDRLRTGRRLRLLIAVAAVPLLAVAGFAVYLASLGNALPWQEEPTPIAVTPFAGLSAAAEPADGSPAAGTAAATPAVVDAAGRTFAIVAGESEARYRVKETVGRISLPTEAVGRTQAIRGELLLDAEGRPLPGSVVEVDLRTFRSGEGQRDNFIQTVTLADAPLAEFAITGVPDGTGPLAEGQERRFTLVGEMTINGVTKELAFDTTATVSGGAVTGTAIATITWDDFGLTPPNVAAQMISVEDEIRMELEITARA